MAAAVKPHLVGHFLDGKFGAVAQQVGCLFRFTANQVLSSEEYRRWPRKLSTSLIPRLGPLYVPPLSIGGTSF